MRILLIRQGAIGDIIVTLPTLAILRGYYPNAYIEVIGNPIYWLVAHKRFYVDEVSSPEKRLKAGLYLKEGEIDKETTDYFSSFDLIIAYINDPEQIVTEKLKQFGARKVLSCPPFPTGEGLHAVDYTAQVLRDLGLRINTPMFPKTHLMEKDLEFAQEFISALTKIEPLVAIHPRTYGIKGWKIEKFIKIGRWIETKLYGKIIWVIGPAEEESIEEIKSNFPSSPLLYLNSLPEVAAVLSLSDLYLGCDTGISHLAASVDTKVIALFGPTNPHIWGPRGKNVWILKSEEVSRIVEQRVEELIIECIKYQGDGEYNIVKDEGQLDAA